MISLSMKIVASKITPRQINYVSTLPEMSSESENYHVINTDTKLGNAKVK